MTYIPHLLAAITKVPPKAASLGLVLFFLLPFAFSQTFMKRFSIYPDTSSPLWVSAGRA